MDMHILHQVVSTASQLPGLLANLIEKGEVETAHILLCAWNEKTMTYKEIHEAAMTRLNEIEK